MNRGIYCIANIENGKRYFGRSVRLRRRIAEHRRKLVAGTHENARVQNAFNKYGAEKFIFSIVEVVEMGRDLLQAEQKWIDEYRSSDRELGYNIFKTAGSPSGYRHSQEAKAKMSEFQSSRPPTSESTRLLISERLKGRVKTAVWIERHRASLTGYRHSDETRRKLSIIRTGRKPSKESIEKTRAAHIGAKRSEEAKMRMRKKRSKEAIANMAAARRLRAARQIAERDLAQ